MSKYNYDKKLDHKKFTVQIDTQHQYGWFEHEVYGDEAGGGLWFENNELVDFDGMMVLPEEVGEAINLLGLKCEIEHFCM